MVKYFCDRCGKECDKLKEIRVPYKKLRNNDFETRQICVCNECNKESEAIYEKLLDIRFILFADYLEKGADNG